jgi:hypothetical protein
MLPIQLESTATVINPLETSRKILVEGAMDGFRAVYRGFGISVPELVEIITPLSEREHS